MNWLTGSRADTFLSPDLPNCFVHDQSQTEPRKHTQASKEEESNAVDIWMNVLVRQFELLF